MRGFAAVFRRELAERRMLALIALLGLVPLALSWLGRPRVSAADARGNLALVLAGVASLILALQMGATIVASDLAERRLGFYFHRPIGAGALWAGKLGAACALSLATGLAILIPTLLVDRSAALHTWALLGPEALSTLQFLALWAGMLVLVVLFTHAASVAIRSRSAWLVLDVVGAAVVGVLFWSTERRLMDWWAPDASAFVMILAASALPLALLAASAAQVARGRTDLQRGHRVLSLALWGVMLSAALAAVGYGRWVLAASPADLTDFFDTEAAPRGDWIGVCGETAHHGGYHAGFLIDAASGRFVRPGPGAFFNEPHFSADGRRCVWAESPPRMMSHEIAYADLGRDAKRVATQIALPSSVQIAVSADGSRIAALSPERLLLYELPQGRLSASVPVKVDLLWQHATVRFLPDGRLRLYIFTRLFRAGSPVEPFVRASGRILEFAPATGRLVQTGAIQEIDPGRWSLSADGERLIYRTPGGRVQLAEAGSGRTLADLSQAGVAARGLGWPSFLSDGRVAFAVQTGQGSEVRLLDRDGALLARYPFPGTIVVLGGEPSPGRLAVGTSRGGQAAADPHLLLLDPASGATREIARGLLPVRGFARPPEAAPPARLFVDLQGRLVWLDPGTGRRRPVLSAPRLHSWDSF